MMLGVGRLYKLDLWHRVQSDVFYLPRFWLAGSLRLFFILAWLGRVMRSAWKDRLFR